MITRQSVAQQLVGDMRIDFRRAYAGMAEHLLDGQQVGAAFQKVGCEAMPESMWADGLIDAVSLGQIFDNQEDHLTSKACSTAIEEDRVGEFRIWRDVKPCTLDVLVEDFQAAVADGHKSFLTALADDAEEAVVTVDVTDL